jgi:predicted house-cleaning noncanonical NTP pyrophosphatase (MazG superfamily)
MTRKIYDKLIRDRIPEIIRADGRECGVEVMSEEDYRQSLFQKVVEEAQEVAEASPEKLIAELADLYEVIDAIRAAFGLDEQAVRAMQAQRRKERGGFVQRFQLLWTD